MLAIVHAYGSTLDPRRKMSFQRAIWGNNIFARLIKSRVMLGKNSPLAVHLRKCTIERLRDLLSLIASEKPYAFLINYIDLSSDDVENICRRISGYPVNIDYVLGIRPRQDSINFVSSILKRFTGKIHVYFLRPEIVSLAVKSSPHHACPLAIADLNKDYFTESHTEDEYVEQVLKLPEYSDAEAEIDAIAPSSAFLYASIYTYEYISYAQTERLISIAGQVIRENVYSRDDIISNPIIWFYNGMYLISDAWKYYLYFRRHGIKIAKDTQDFFFALYAKLVENADCNKSDFIKLRLITDGLKGMKSGRKGSDITISFANYHISLIDKCEYILRKFVERKMDGIKSYALAKDISKATIEVSTYSIKLIIALFETSQQLDILDDVLDGIDNLLSCYGVFDSQFLLSKFWTSIVEFITLCSDVGKKWSDITLAVKITHIVEMILEKGGGSKKVDIIIKNLEYANEFVSRHGGRTLLRYSELKEEECISMKESVKNWRNNGFAQRMRGDDENVRQCRRVLL